MLFILHASNRKHKLGGPNDAARGGKIRPTGGRGWMGRSWLKQYSKNKKNGEGERKYFAPADLFGRQLGEYWGGAPRLKKRKRGVNAPSVDIDGSGNGGKMGGDANSRSLT